MQIEILGTESQGVRGLSCEVKVKDRRIVIDPGLALGYQRCGLLPHPAQVAVGEQVRRKIVKALKDATDVVLSHFHGDHVPLLDANPYQLNAQKVAPLPNSSILGQGSRGPLRCYVTPEGGFVHGAGSGPSRRRWETMWANGFKQSWEVMMPRIEMRMMFRPCFGHPASRRGARVIDTGLATEHSAGWRSASISSLAFVGTAGTGLGERAAAG